MLKPTRDEVEAYITKMGRFGEQTLTALGKLQGFAECMQTEFGQEFLTELIGRYEELLKKLSELVATEEEKLEFKVTRQLLLTYAMKINRYNQRIKEIKGMGTKRGEG